jgi:phage gp29-like protein
LEFESAKTTRQARLLAKKVKGAWPEIGDEAQLGQLLRWGLLLGIGVAQLIWRTSDDGWIPKLQVWHPSFLTFRWDTRSYWMSTQDGQIEVPEDGGSKWLVYCPYGYYRSWMEGRVRPLALPWLVRGWARRDWARYSEVHGIPAKKAIVPPTADVEQKTRFSQMLSNLGNEPVIECEQGQDGNRFDYQLVEAQANNWEGFSKLIEHADVAIAVTLLGQNLTTEVKQGSRAAAQVHDGVRRDFQQADAVTLGRALQKQLLGPWSRFNFNLEALAPFPAWQIEPPEDELSQAQALRALAAAVSGLKQADAPVDLVALLEQYGIPHSPNVDEQPANDVGTKNQELASSGANGSHLPSA